MTLSGAIERRLSRSVGGRARQRVVGVFGAVLALQGADTATIGAVASQLKHGLHIGNTGLGLLVTVSAGVGAVATLPLGTLADRVNRSRLLTSAIVIWALAMLISGASTTFTMLLVTRLALGVVVAVSGPVIASLAGDLFPPGERGRLYGFILSGELLGGGFGFLVSGNIGAVLGWRWAFWVMAGLSALVAGAVYRFLPEPARGGASMLSLRAEHILTADEAHDRTQADDQSDDSGPPDRRPGPLEVLIEQEGIAAHDGRVLQRDAADRSLWWSVRYILSIRTNLFLVVASALGYSMFAGVRTFGVLFVQHRFGVGSGLASLLLVVLGAGGVLGVLLSGRIADGLIGRGHLAARPVVAGVCFLLAAAMFVPALLIGSLIVAAPFFFLTAAGIGGTNPPLDAARLDLMPGRLWGRAEAVRTSLRSLLEGGAPLLIGVLATQFGTPTSGLGQATSSGNNHGQGLAEAFLIMAIPVALAGLLLLLRARRTYARDVATALASHANTSP